MEKIAYYGLRSTVRPGVTGWAQIRYGYANNLAEETEKMRYDLYYIKNRSLWLDVRIMLETVAHRAVRQGATEVRRRRAPLRPQRRVARTRGPRWRAQAQTVYLRAVACRRRGRRRPASAGQQ